MDRYFYIIEQDENGHKVIHMQGNIYANGDGDFRHAEYTFLFFSVSLAQNMIDDESFFATLDENVDYIEDITEKTAVARTEKYFDGDSGTQLHISDITEHTPCGCYYFERS